MAGVNKVIIMGRLGQDPEVRYAQNGNAIANLTVATSETWKDKQTGEKKEATEWHRVVLFGKIAEVAGEYLRKGTMAYFEGKLKTRKWQAQDGTDKYTTEIVVDVTGTMQLLGGKQEGGQQQQQHSGTQSQQQRQQTGMQQASIQLQRPQQQSAPASDDGWADQDIPF